MVYSLSNRLAGVNLAIKYFGANKKSLIYCENYAKIIII